MVVVDQRPAVTPRRFARVVALLLLSILPLAVPARVYWLTGRGETGGVLAPDPAWTRAYAVMLRINAGRAGMEVWNARLSLDEAVEEVRKQVQADGGTLWMTGEGEMRWAIGYAGDRVIRILFNAGDGPRQCLVFQLSQTLEDFNASLTPPERHMMKAAPEFPGSSPVSFLGSDTTGLELATASAPVQAAEAQSYYARQLTGAGWAPAFKPGKGADIYLREREMMLVSAKSTSEGSGCLLMLLHKPLSSGAAR